MCVKADRHTTALWRHPSFDEDDGHAQIRSCAFLCSGTGGQWGGGAQGVPGKTSLSTSHFCSSSLKIIVLSHTG